MKHCFVNCLIAFSFSSVLQAYRWSPTPENDARFKACEGGDVSFPWPIVTDGKDEEIVYIDWLFQAPGKANVSIAIYVEGNFFTKANKDRFTFTPNAGLHLQGAQTDDAGRYYVRVNLHDEKCLLTSVERMVTLSVAERAPAVQNDSFLVTMSDAIWDDVIEDWTLQLRCGRFVDFGHPPVDVIWTMPSGEVRNSSHEDNGTFVLSVSSPVQGGNYSCHLPPSAPAARCLTDTSPLNAAAQLYMDDKDVRLSLLELLVHFDKMVRVNSDQASLLHNQSRFIQNQASLLKDQGSRLQDQSRLTLKDQDERLRDHEEQIQILDSLYQEHQILLKNQDQADLLQNQSRLIRDQASLLRYLDKRLEDHEERLQIQDSLLQNQSRFTKDQASRLQDQDKRLGDHEKRLHIQDSLLQNQSRFIQDQASLLTDQDSRLQGYASLLQVYARLLQDQSRCILDQTSLQDEIITNLKLGRAERTFSSCVDWLAVDPRSGVRTLTVHGEAIRVYCDQTTDGGGWTVFQRRQDRSVDFYRGWKAYRGGFGDLQGNFWLGLDNLHNLTSSGDYLLRIDMTKFDGTSGSATYTGFHVAGVDQNFTLNFDSFAGGNADDSLSMQNKQQFSTHDADHDTYSVNCASIFHGAWWYAGCHVSHLNGRYKDSRVYGEDGVTWYRFDGYHSLKFSEMKMRPS
uniref:VIgL family fibrinogen-related protein 3 isoform 2 n=1 Tax=Littorina littorea TaxID=31216 RepID=A0A411DEK8_LITLI|nr:VIgL family fibrinogen-related protein 3 isoform 2 [Littorina littorea]